MLFDYGLVLTGPPHPPAWEQMKSILGGADEETFFTAYWRPRHDYDRGTLNGEAYWRHVAKDLGRSLDKAELTSLYEADSELWTRPNQPMITWAAALQAAKIRTGILSNLGDEMEIGVRQRCAWIEAFDHLTFSHHLRTAKPDLAIYRHAAQGVGVEPAHVLFIDDRADNIEAAREAGMQAIRYMDHLQFEADMVSGGFGDLLHPAPKGSATKVEARFPAAER